MGTAIWNIQTHSQLKVLKGHTSALKAITFVENDSLLLTYGGDGTIRFWDVSAHE
jgi:WD40 repeat protein